MSASIIWIYCEDSEIWLGGICYVATSQTVQGTSKEPFWALPHVLIQSTNKSSERARLLHFEI